MVIVFRFILAVILSGAKELKPVIDGLAEQSIQFLVLLASTLDSGVTYISANGPRLVQFTSGL